MKELQNAGFTLDQALRTARTARDHRVPALDPKSAPQTVLRVLKAVGFAWRFAILGVIVLGYFNVWTFEFGPLLAVFALVWLGLVGLNGFVAAHFFAQHTAIVAGSIWLTRTAGYACQSTKTGLTRLVLRWVAKQPSPWRQAAQLQMAPMFIGFAMLCLVAFGLAAWVFVAFDVIRPPTASSG